MPMESSSVDGSPYTYEARLMQRQNGRHAIYDGDTLWLTVDLGFGLTFDLGPCRLFGIDTPEVNRTATKAAGIEARDYVRNVLEPLETFLITTVKDSKGKYGRYLVHVHLSDTLTLNKALVLNGLAIEKNY